MAINRREFFCRIMAGGVGGAVALLLRDFGPAVVTTQREAKKRHIFLIDDAERHWFSAENKNEALRMYTELYGDDELEGLMIEQKADNEELKVFTEEPFRDPSPAKTQTCKEWGKEQSGLIASSLY